MASFVKLVICGASLVSAGSASAATREVMAFCTTSNTSLITNIAPVAIPANITAENTEYWYNEIRDKIAYGARATMNSVGASSEDTIGCTFSDPSQPYVDINGNMSLESLQYSHRVLFEHDPGTFRAVQVARLDSEPFPQRSTSTPTASSTKRPAGPPIGPRPTPVAQVKGPTPNQLKYQRQLAEYQQRLADIERVKSDAAAKLANGKAAAQQALEQHEQEMAKNRQQVAQADQARRQYEIDLAAQQAMVERNRTKQDLEALVDWPEAVTVCELNSQNPQSKFGNWKCTGPLQFDYAKLGVGGSRADPKALFNVSNACGGQVASIRDLGMVNGYHVFGCSFGIHPDPAQRISPDKAAQFGLGYIAGRNTYRCPKYVSYCRTR